MALVRLVVLNAVGVAARSFYLSSSGNDQSDGSSPSSAWQTLAPLKAVASLGPGDSVRLRRGDSWTGQLHLSAQGSQAAPVIFEAFGDASLPAPLLQGTDPSRDRCLTLEAPSHVQLQGLAFRHAKIGVYLRYDGNTDVGASQVSITDCAFSDMADREFDPTKQPFNNEISYASGVWLGGVPPRDPNGNRTILDGLSVSGSTFYNVALGIGCNWYWMWPSSVFFGYFKNIAITENVMRNVGMGVALSWVESVTLDGLDVYEAGMYAWPTGNTALFLQFTNMVTIQRSRFGATKRIDATGSCADGVAIDLEGCNHNVRIEDVMLHDCQGPGMLQMASEGKNSDVDMQRITVYRNALQAAENEMCMMQSWEDCDRCKIEASSIYARSGVPAFSENHKWDSFTMTSVATSDEGAVLTLPTAWDFAQASDVLSWTPYDVADFTVSEGALRGSITSASAHVVTAQTWANGFDCRLASLELFVSAGTRLALQFITETDLSWDVAKSVTLPLAPGEWTKHDLDLRRAAGWQGVIRQVALFPTEASGATFALRSFELRCSSPSRAHQFDIV